MRIGASLFIIVFALAAGAFALSRAPLSAATRALDLRSHGVGYSRAEGTLWNGRIANVSVAGQRIGDVTVGLQPAALLGGAVKARWSVNGDAAVGRGSAWRSLTGEMGLENVSLQTNFNAGAIIGGVGAGRVRADIDRLVMGRNGCEDASGVLWTDALTTALGAYGWKGPALSGDISCADGVITAPMTGATDSDDISVVAIIRQDFSYRVRGEIYTTDQRLRDILTNYGLRRGEGVFAFEHQGRLVFGGGAQ